MYVCDMYVQYIFECDTYMFMYKNVSSRTTSISKGWKGICERELKRMNSHVQLTSIKWALTACQVPADAWRP